MESAFQKTGQKQKARSWGAGFSINPAWFTESAAPAPAARINDGNDMPPGFYSLERLMLGLGGRCGGLDEGTYRGYGVHIFKYMQTRKDVKASREYFPPGLSDA